MTKEKKKVKSAKYMNRFEHLFACPLCQSSMAVVDNKSLICKKNHSFDVAKQGYINLTTTVIHTKYSRELFEARHHLIVESEFFQPVTDKIAEIISQHVSKNEDIINIIDMGSGEGSHLVTICDDITLQTNQHVLGVGIDISKEAIIEAAKNYSEKIWAVADLANTPFQNDSFHVILNFLSPSNYGEFNRLLTPEGLVVKVVPQSDYLKELREQLYDNTEKQTYTNEDTVNHFEKNYHLMEKQRLTYTMTLDRIALGWLLQMTPLAWNASDERLKELQQKDNTNITVDLEILVGKPLAN